MDTKEFFFVSVTTNKPQICKKLDGQGVNVTHIAGIPTPFVDIKDRGKRIFSTSIATAMLPVEAQLNQNGLETAYSNILEALHFYVPRHKEVPITQVAKVMLEYSDLKFVDTAVCLVASTCYVPFVTTDISPNRFLLFGFAMAASEALKSAQEFLGPYVNSKKFSKNILPLLRALDKSMEDDPNYKPPFSMIAQHRQGDASMLAVTLKEYANTPVPVLIERDPRG